MQRRRIMLIILLGLGVFLAWRLLRPMNIFVVDDRFAWPVDTSQAPAALDDLSASGCAACHPDFYREWRTTVHSRAWTDPYFQVDWAFDGSQHICRLCHTPLDRQQPQRVLGYRDRDKWDPVLADNPAFDPALQHEGVTCAACHYRDGAIVGVLGTKDAPHPVTRLADPNQVCVRCHVVAGERWDTFWRFPPCGTVAEIESTPAPVAAQPGPGRASRAGHSGEVGVENTRALGCVRCHMPLAERPLVEGGAVRATRRHLWRGGHDPDMVRQALSVDLAQVQPAGQHNRLVRLTLTNTGAAHYVPTGTPDRHLTVHLRLLDEHGEVLDERVDTLRRTVLWRPFIIDLWDNRLVRGQPRRFELEVPADTRAVQAAAEVRYHLLDERRRRRIGYRNETPIDYAVFRGEIPLRAGSEERDGRR